LLEHRGSGTFLRRQTANRTVGEARDGSRYGDGIGLDESRIQRMSCETGLADDFSMLDVGIASGDRWSGVRVQTMLARRAGELPETYLFRHVIVVTEQATPANVTWIGGPAIDLGREGVPRRAIIFPALQPYQARWDAANTCILVELAPELLDEAGRRYGSGGHVDLRPGLAVDDRFIPSMADALVDLATRDASATLLAESLGLTLATHLVQTRGSAAGEATGGVMAPAKLRLLTEFIEARLESAISVADLANLADMGVFHFARCFKQTTGRTPHQYVLRRRIERARHLLVNPRLSVAEVALRCGFSQQSHFSETFRRMVGTSPRLYRNASGAQSG
jgi:AraC-like DNA-binding protein